MEEEGVPWSWSSGVPVSGPVVPRSRGPGHSGLAGGHNKNHIFEKLNNELIILCITKENLKFHQNRFSFVEVLASLKFVKFP